MMDKNNFEVIIIGGSYAGLSSAMSLGRSLRNVLIIDSGFPCNRQTPHSHNFITQDGKTPKEIASIARQQVENYATVKFYNGLAASGRKTDKGFEIITETKEKFTAGKLIFATGIKDIMPDIKGFSACWGISVIHCPYCHGYEYRNQNTGIIANGPKAYHIASLVSNLTDKITILTSGTADFTTEQKEKLDKHNINVIETKISEIENKNGKIQNVIFNDGKKISFDVAYAAISFIQNTDIPASLGCTLTEQGHISVDSFNKTNIQDVYACGDNSTMMRSVASAVYTGNVTGAIVNADLVNEQF